MTRAPDAPAAKGAHGGGEALFRDLFETNPYPLVIEDWSRLKAHFESRRAAGIEDLAAHFAAHSEAARRIPDLIQMIERDRRRTS